MDADALWSVFTVAASFVTAVMLIAMWRNRKKRR